MERAQIEHCGEVALYTRFLAVCLMRADQADQVDMAALYLELCSSVSSPGTVATHDDAQALLDYIRPHYKPSWAKTKKGNPPTRSPFSVSRAMEDCRNSSWFMHLATTFIEGDGARAEAERFLRLRQQVILETLEPIAPEQVDAFLKAFEDLVLELAREIQGEDEAAKVVDLGRYRERKAGVG